MSRPPSGPPSSRTKSHGRNTAESDAVQGRPDTERFRAQMLELAARIQPIVEHAPAAIAFYQESGQCLQANPALARMVGATLEAVKGQNFRSLQSWRTSGMLHHAEQVLATGQPVEHDTHLITTFGADLWMRYRLSPATLDGRKHLLLLAEDITVQRRREQALLLKHWRLMEIHAITKQIAAETSPSDVMQTTIDRLCPLLGADFGAMVRIDDNGVPCGKVHSSRNAVQTIPPGIELRGQGVLRRIAAGFVLHSADVSSERDYVDMPPWHPEVGPIIGAPVMDHGKVLAVLLIGRRKGAEPFDDDDRSIVEILASLAAVSTRMAERFTELQQLNRSLAQQVHTDLLTGLGNRHAFEQALDVKHSEATRYGIGYGLLVADLDCFKSNHDCSGHKGDDQRLAKVAGLLCRAVRMGDSVFRYGGEELVVLLSHQSLTGVEAAGERLRKLIEASGVQQRNNASTIVTVHIGGTAFDPISAVSESHTWRDVLRTADEALDEAKSQGTSAVSIRRL